MKNPRAVTTLKFIVEQFPSGSTFPENMEVGVLYELHPCVFT